MNLKIGLVWAYGAYGCNNFNNKSIMNVDEAIALCLDIEVSNNLLKGITLITKELFLNTGMSTITLLKEVKLINKEGISNYKKMYLRHLGKQILIKNRKITLGQFHKISSHWIRD